MKKALLLLFILVLICPASISAGQIAKFKALFLFNFAQNIGWPNDATSGDFIITIVGDNEIVRELTELSQSRTIGGNKLVVRSAESIGSIDRTHIIYLAPDKCGLLPNLLSLKENEPILIVGGEQGLCERGAGISFLMRDGRLRFQISPQNIERHGLNTSSRLIALGDEVR
ncbi:YfiR family protein [Alkalitalea saponilacus]|uniref:DUF4154 domain-containing protein n=1 Tax=Alkalitalea saponilacus TaxID=889453 RepID=A0A1T5CDD5_9BACT|nr:YfiR family protein [Alkalitalea saponilacus]ASB49826.1 hypothetical protein CDL62_12115 [Alkalitalea saponilacus]SKB57454.1 protein of unknown function [Alkalitalea saponilacus]